MPLIVILLANNNIMFIRTNNIQGSNEMRFLKVGMGEEGNYERQSKGGGGGGGIKHNMRKGNHVLFFM